MTKQEYNRDVKRLAQMVHKTKDLETTAFDAELEEKLKAEFTRLYRADMTFKLANKQSVLTMLRLNLRFRFMPLHSFGLFIEL